MCLYFRFIAAENYGMRFFFFFLFSSAALGAISTDPSIFKMPNSCQELLPDSSPFLNFFEAVGKGTARKHPDLSRRIFKIIALKDKLTETTGRSDTNPIETLIRKTICFYREQKEPLKHVTYDDVEFIKFMSVGIKELENKCEEAIFDLQYEDLQRQEYERQLERSQATIQKLRAQASQEAERVFSQISKSAKRKAALP